MALTKDRPVYTSIIHYKRSIKNERRSVRILLGHKGPKKHTNLSQYDYQYSLLSLYVYCHPTSSETLWDRKETMLLVATDSVT